MFRYIASALRNLLVGIGALIFCGAVIAAADYLFTAGAGSTMFAFTCFATKVCPAHVNVTSAGVELNALNVGTVATPGTDVITTQRAILFPSASTPITGNSSGSTQSVVGTLAGTTSKTTFICGFSVGAQGGNALISPLTLAGLTSSMIFPLASSPSPTTLPSMQFNPCMPASAANTAITLTTTADGTATAVDVNMWGYQQ